MKEQYITTKTADNAQHNLNLYLKQITGVVNNLWYTTSAVTMKKYISTIQRKYIIAIIISILVICIGAISAFFMFIKEDIRVEHITNHYGEAVEVKYFIRPDGTLKRTEAHNENGTSEVIYYREGYYRNEALELITTLKNTKRHETYFNGTLTTKTYYRPDGSGYMRETYRDNGSKDSVLYYDEITPKEIQQRRIQKVVKIEQYNEDNKKVYTRNINTTAKGTEEEWIYYKEDGKTIDRTEYRDQYGRATNSPEDVLIKQNLTTIRTVMEIARLENNNEYPAPSGLHRTPVAGTHCKRLTGDVSDLFDLTNAGGSVVEKYMPSFPTDPQDTKYYISYPRTSSATEAPKQYRIVAKVNGRTTGSLTTNVSTGAGLHNTGTNNECNCNVAINTTGGGNYCVGAGTGI